MAHSPTASNSSSECVRERMLLLDHGTLANCFDSGAAVQLSRDGRLKDSSSPNAEVFTTADSVAVLPPGATVSSPHRATPLS
jgi:hypothetical protein